ATAALGEVGAPGGGMHAGAGLFDGVRYGGAAATEDDDRLLRDLDDAVAAARPRPEHAGETPVLAVPR
ncbi:hypothetical protein DY240_22620, partial [Jiangella rhizosphaerae]